MRAALRIPLLSSVSCVRGSCHVPLSCLRAVSSEASDPRFTEPIPGDAKVYMCIARDRADSKRLEVRQRHLATAAEGHRQGWILQGGAFLTEPDVRGHQSMFGSFMLLRARDLAHAKEIIANDIYTTGGAWDADQTTIVEASNFAASRGHS